MVRSQRLKNNKIDDFTNKTNMIIGGVDSCKGREEKSGEKISAPIGAWKCNFLSF